MSEFFNKHKSKIGLGLILLGVIIIVAIIPIVVETNRGKKNKVDDELTSTTKSTTTKKPFDPSVLTNEEKSRIDCFLDQESSKVELTRFACEQRGCIYNPSQYDRVPSCYFDRENVGYLLDRSLINSNLIEYTLKRNNAKSIFNQPVDNLRLNVEYLGENIVHVKITDATKDRYEVPYQLNRPNKLNDISKSSAQFQLFEDPVTKLVSFRIIRRSNNDVIFDSSMGAFIFNEQYLQISTKLSSEYIYGFGENNHDNLKHDLNFRSWGMFARDQAHGWGDNRNLYGFQPVYMMMENSGKSHLVLWYNSNAMEYLFNPYPSLTMRSIGGIFDLYFVVDEKVDQVLQSYHKLIGLPIFPPYWSLGFQISRWGYSNLSQVQQVIERTKALNIPQDVQFLDIDYMIGFRILTVDQENFKGFGTYMKKIREDGMRLVLIVDPGIVMERNNSIYMTGVDRDIYVKWPQNLAPYDKDSFKTDDMISWCWPNGKISYPDYMNERTHTWWEQSLKDFMANETHGCDMDGLWIDMNEPSSFETNEIKPWNWLYPEDDLEKYPYFTLKCPTNRFDDPPYRTKNTFLYDGDNLVNKFARLSAKTLCMIATHTMNGKTYLHYDVHNLYAHSQAIASYKALVNVKKNLRPFTLTRSNFVGTGHWAAHWTGDNDSTWKHMKNSIIGIIEYNIFGIPMVGADICGFFIDIRDAEMCTRWFQVGAFYPYSRNHNAKNRLDKDPAAYNNKTLEDSTRAVYKLRYGLLPYYYTLFYKVHLNGGSVAKALFFEFPNEKDTFNIDEQFLIGPSFLITPVLRPGETTVRAYLPQAVWYDYRTGRQTTTLGWQTWQAPLDYIHLHLRGGSILPIQDPRDFRNTTWTRTNPMGLIVALDENKKASGELFWDDGESFNYASDTYYHAEFKYENDVLSIQVRKNNIQTIIGKLVLDDVKIYGFNNPNFVSSNQNIIYDNTLKVLTLKNLGKKLDKDETIDFNKPFTF